MRKLMDIIHPGSTLPGSALLIHDGPPLRYFIGPQSKPSKPIGLREITRQEALDLARKQEAMGNEEAGNAIYALDDGV